MATLFGLICVTFIALFLYIEEAVKRVRREYNVTANKQRWIVRDSKGKFVAMPKKTFNGVFNLVMLLDK